MNTLTGWFLNISIVAIVLVLQGCASPSSVSLHTVMNGSHQDIPGYRCTRGAHRGDSFYYVENSPKAIHSARHNPRFSFIEFDVQFTADNQAVVFHDKNLLRVFGKTNKIEHSTTEELRRLSGGEIATYCEIMELAEGKALNIEIKSHGNEEDDERMADLIMTDVKERKIEDHVLISSISANAIKYVNEHYPEVATGQIFFLTASTYVHLDFLTEGLYRKIDESQADYIMLHISNLHNIEDLIRLKPKGKTLIFWAFDDTMYIVHKDLSDRLWGDGGFKTFFKWLRYKTSWHRSKI